MKRLIKINKEEELPKMWRVYTQEGKIIQEGEMTWAEAKTHKIIKIECEFGGNTISIDIPDGCTPIFFNTAETGLNGHVRIISQSIGFDDGIKERYTRLMINGTISQEEGPRIH